MCKGCDLDETYETILPNLPRFSLLVSGVFRGIGIKVNGWFASEEPLWRNESQYLKLWLSFQRDHNVYVDYTNSFGLTCLQSLLVTQNFAPHESHHMSSKEMTEDVFVLCALGADVSATTPIDGLQPLHLVAFSSYSPDKAFYIKTQFKILLDFGADPFARDDKGRTVGRIAFSRGWFDQWCEALLECKPLELVEDIIRAGLLGLEERPFHDTIRTGVDAADLSKPSAEGLSRRITSRGDRLDY